MGGGNKINKVAIRWGNDYKITSRNKAIHLLLPTALFIPIHLLTLFLNTNYLLVLIIYRHYLSIGTKSTTALAMIPSCRPVKPSFSVVVALTLILLISVCKSLAIFSRIA